jgi:hypothetical protein
MGLRAVDALKTAIIDKVLRFNFILNIVIKVNILFIEVFLVYASFFDDGKGLIDSRGDDLGIREDCFRSVDRTPEWREWGFVRLGCQL